MIAAGCAGLVASLARSTGIRSGLPEVATLTPGMLRQRVSGWSATHLPGPRRKRACDIVPPWFHAGSGAGAAQFAVGGDPVLLS